MIECTIPATRTRAAWATPQVVRSSDATTNKRRNVRRCAIPARPLRWLALARDIGHTCASFAAAFVSLYCVSSFVIVRCLLATRPCRYVDCRPLLMNVQVKKNSKNCGFLRSPSFCSSRYRWHTKYHRQSTMFYKQSARRLSNCYTHVT